MGQEGQREVLRRWGLRSSLTSLPHPPPLLTSLFIRHSAHPSIQSVIYPSVHPFLLIYSPTHRSVHHSFIYSSILLSICLPVSPPPHPPSIFLHPLLILYSFRNQQRSPSIMHQIISAGHKDEGILSPTSQDGGEMESQGSGIRVVFWGSSAQMGCGGMGHICWGFLAYECLTSIAASQACEAVRSLMRPFLSSYDHQRKVILGSRLSPAVRLPTH